MEELTYRLDIFEGPLDLLLSLISKSKVSITDIPISEICDQYMQYIDAARNMDLEIASEFLVMASELMLIKSKMLLPRVSEEAEDPRSPLIDALLLYKKAKEAAGELRPLYEEYWGRFEKDSDDIPPEKGFPLGLEPELLTKALNTLLFRLNTIEKTPRQLITPLISTKIVPVEEKIDNIITILATQKRASLFFILRDESSRSDLLSAFLAILELIKLGRILICDGDNTTESDENITEDTHPEWDSGLTVMFEINPDYFEINPDYPDYKEENTSIESEFANGNNETASV